MANCFSSMRNIKAKPRHSPIFAAKMNDDGSRKDTRIHSYVYRVPYLLAFYLVLSIKVGGGVNIVEQTRCATARDFLTTYVPSKLLDLSTVQWREGCCEGNISCPLNILFAFFFLGSRIFFLVNFDLIPLALSYRNQPLLFKWARFYECHSRFHRTCEAFLLSICIDIKRWNFWGGGLSHENIPIKVNFLLILRIKFVLF